MTLATIPRYDDDRLTRREGHAVVLGGSMAGMLAARVLADRYDSVTVIDRDPLVDEPIARRGVPQSHQPHGLLEGGRATLEDLFPGYCEALVEAGGVVVDLATDLEFYDRDVPMAGRPMAPAMYCATRPLLELIARRQLAGVEGIELRECCQFVDYIFDKKAETVRGVTIRDGSAGPTELRADLVVDATGRSSRTPAWLAAHGYSRPDLDEVRIDITYSTVVVERPSDDRRIILAPASAPTKRGGVVIPAENDRWYVNLHGFHGDRPPADAADFRTYAADLETPAILDLLTAHELVDDTVHRYPFPSNRRYQYELLDRFPDGLLVVGDAIASFNPIYGQGMTVAALEALWLHHVLAEGEDDLAPRFFERAATVVQLAWALSVGPDLNFPETVGERPFSGRLIGKYVERLQRRARTDSALSDAFGRVIHFERPPTSLFAPTLLWRVFTPIPRRES